MNETDFERYLSDRYQDQVNWYDRKAASNQAMYKKMQWTVIVLAAVSPFLIELTRDISPAWLAHVPTFTAALVAILTTALKTFQYQEHWINYRTTCETLRKEKHYFDAGAGEYGTAKDRNSLFVERVEALISRENTIWVTAQRQEKKTKAERPAAT